MTDMKKLITLLSIVITSSVMAQNLSTFGLSGNADHLVQNPGADPITSFQLRYFGFQSNIGLNLTAGDLFGTPDILGNIANSEFGSTDFTIEQNFLLPHLGVKLGNAYVFAGASVDLGMRASFDNDIVHFVRYGMVDDAGNFDPNYSGDFSDLGITIQANQNTYVGFQTLLMHGQLRVGGTYTLHNNLTSFNVQATNFNLTAVGGANGPESFALNYDVDIAGGIDFGTVDSLDQFGDLDGDQILDDFINGYDPVSSTASSLGFGLTFKPLETFEIQFSMNGIGGGSTDFNSTTSKVWSGSSTIDGFSYTSAPGDSLGAIVGDQATDYISGLTSSIGTSLTNGTYQQTLNVARNTNLAANFFFTKRSYVGAHYTSRSNSFRNYEYMGVTGLLWVGRNLQLKGGYYASLDAVNSNVINAAIQMRITPFLQFYVGSNSISDVATIANSIMEDPENLQIGRETNAVNFSAGFNFAVFDGRFREERKAEREAKAAGKRAQATGLSKAQTKKVKKKAKKSNTKSKKKKPASKVKAQNKKK